MNLTHKRLIGELKDLAKNKVDYVQAYQDEINPLIFYFMLKPKNEPYSGGLYIGRIELPKDYPFNPGKFFMLTPSGRFNINKEICLTNSHYHTNNWTPVWSIRTMIIGFMSILTDDSTSGISHIHDDNNTRLQYSKQSHDYNISHHKNITLNFNQFVNSDGIIHSDSEILDFISH